MFFYAIITREELECWWELEEWGGNVLAELPGQDYYLAFGEACPGEGDEFGEVYAFPPWPVANVQVSAVTDVTVGNTPCTEGGIVEIVSYDLDEDDTQEIEGKKSRIFRRFEELIQD